MYVNRSQVRRAAGTATDVGQSVPVSAVQAGAAEAAAAVAGGESATALTDVSSALKTRLVALQVAVQGWSDEVQEALAAYEALDDATGARLSQMQWRAV